MYEMYNMHNVEAHCICNVVVGHLLWLCSTEDYLKFPMLKLNVTDIYHFQIYHMLHVHTFFYNLMIKRDFENQ